MKILLVVYALISVLNSEKRFLLLKELIISSHGLKKNYERLLDPKNTVLSGLLCNTKLSRNLYGFFTKWKMSPINSGDILVFNLNISTAKVWRFLSFTNIT